MLSDFLSFFYRSIMTPFRYQMLNLFGLKGKGMPVSTISALEAQMRMLSWKRHLSASQSPAKPH